MLNVLIYLGSFKLFIQHPYWIILLLLKDNGVPFNKCFVCFYKYNLYWNLFTPPWSKWRYSRFVNRVHNNLNINSWKRDANSKVSNWRRKRSHFNLDPRGPSNDDLRRCTNTVWLSFVALAETTQMYFMITPRHHTARVLTTAVPQIIIVSALLMIYIILYA